MQFWLGPLVELRSSYIQKINQAVKFWMSLLPSEGYGPFLVEDTENQIRCQKSRESLRPSLVRIFHPFPFQWGRRRGLALQQQSLFQRIRDHPQ